MIQKSSRSPKTHSLPKLLSTGFFHPTLKGSVSTSEIVSPGLLRASKGFFGKTHNKVWKIQKNKKYIEETVRVKEEIIEEDNSAAGMSASATEITESLDKMLEDFEKEEEEA